MTIDDADDVEMVGYDAGLLRGNSTVSPDRIVQEEIIGHLRKRSFDLASVTELDLLQNDPTRILMRQIFGAIPHCQHAMIITKLPVRDSV